METNRKRIRKEYAPLKVSISVSCASQYSPLQQVYDAESNTYQPNRQLSPTVLRPQVTAHAVDGSWPDPSANSMLSDMHWYCNDQDITTMASWQGQFEIDAQGSSKGSLIIRRNVAPGERLSMRFEARLVDNRMGVVIPIVSDAMVLSTYDKSTDSYSMSIGDTQAVEYNPFLDKLALYQYKVAEGLQSPSAAAEQASRDGHEYERTIPVTVYRGGAPLTGGYTLKLYAVNSVAALTELIPGANEVRSITSAGVSLDLRLVTKSNYMLKAFVGGTEVARLQFSVCRVVQPFTCTPTNEAAIEPHAALRFDSAEVNSEGNRVEYPGRLIKITWFTDTAAATGVQHNEGHDCVIDLSRAAIGKTYQDDWMEVYTVCEIKPAHSIATDGGEVLTDASGEVFIFN